MGYLLWTLLLEDTIEDTRHHFQGLTFTNLVSFQLPLDYGIVYQFQLLTSEAFRKSATDFMNK